MKFDLVCQRHPKYKAVKYPKSRCSACAKLWFLRSSGSMVVEYSIEQGFIRLVAK